MCPSIYFGVKSGSSWKPANEALVTLRTSILLICVLTACGPSLEDRMVSLVHAKNTWIEVSAGRDYAFDMTKECFCANNGRTFRVRVEGGAIVGPREYPGLSKLTGENSQFSDDDPRVLSTGSNVDGAGTRFRRRYPRAL